MTFTTQLSVLLILQAIFYRVSKNEIRTKSETRKTHKKVGFIGMVVLVGPSAEPQPRRRRASPLLVLSFGAFDTRRTRPTKRETGPPVGCGGGLRPPPSSARQRIVSCSLSHSDDITENNSSSQTNVNFLIVSQVSFTMSCHHAPWGGGPSW